MSLFQYGNHTLASGQRSTWKIDCDALSGADWDCLADMLVPSLPNHFCEVLGVPRGGEPFAKALDRFSTRDADHRLIVDDVYTTGGSLFAFEREIAHERESRPVMRAVVFARNKPPLSIFAMFIAAQGL